jgi:hypothetical protein
MPWLPEDAPHDLLAAVSPEQWNAWADGAPIGPPPHLRVECACEISEDFDDDRDKNDVIEYKKGMQGRLFECGTVDGVEMAKIYITGITEGKSGVWERLVPLKYIIKGKPWKSEFVNAWGEMVKS